MFLSVWSVEQMQKVMFVRTKNRRIMLLSKCSLRNKKKLKFFKEQEPRGLLSNLMGIKIIFLSILPILPDL